MTRFGSDLACTTRQDGWLSFRPGCLYVIQADVEGRTGRHISASERSRAEQSKTTRLLVINRYPTSARRGLPLCLYGGGREAIRELALQSTCTIQVTYKKTCFGGGGKSRIFVTNKFTEEAWSEDRDMGGSGELAVLGQATTVRKRGGAFFPQAPSSGN